MNAVPILSLILVNMLTSLVSTIQTPPYNCLDNSWLFKKIYTGSAIKNENLETITLLDEDRGTRNSRATCDLLSVSLPFGSFNHAACAAHCIAKGYKGGSCKGGVCHCRR